MCAVRLRTTAHSSNVFPPPREFVRPLAPTSTQCANTYAPLWKDGVLKIAVVLGYKDARPNRFVGDRYERAAVTSYLTAECVPGWAACGFAQDEYDPDLFRKEGVELRLAHSAAGPDDDENRKDAFQKWMSQNAEKTFFTGLRDSDVVFYNGHSRDGGGPDFRPPQLTADKHVDYPWYARERPQMKRLFDNLEAAQTQVRLLGLFSCSSSNHFLEELSNLRPELGLITSHRLLYYSDALRNLLGALSAVLQKQCAPALDEALALGSGERPMRVRAFFSH